MNRYMPLTGVDCSPAALLIDTQAPLDVLHDFALLLAIPLRDGCDVLDVIGRRLQAQAMA
ncbi:hypothetical protein [Pseudomonas sp. Q11]|uniref:hypothetical protein n=1 Tax=Pseudomonas sp. Q11 TaxID=2968470 RepID=UPI00210E90E0|nr:hypothetical protein [Pseudomonas sp. Q11]MCQ6257541.1 hypothetical protein [Pseudomonas sp. Q11]